MDIDKLINDFKNTLFDADYDCRWCVLKKLCMDRCKDDNVLCAEDTDTFQRVLEKHYKEEL